MRWGSYPGLWGRGPYCKRKDKRISFREIRNIRLLALKMEVDAGGPWKLEKARKQILLSDPQKEHSPANTSILGLLTSTTIK